MTNPDGMSLGGFGSAESIPVLVVDQQPMPPIETFVGKLGEKLTEIHLIDIERSVLVLLLCPLCVYVCVCVSLSPPLSLFMSFALLVLRLFLPQLVCVGAKLNKKEEQEEERKNQKKKKERKKERTKKRTKERKNERTKEERKERATKTKNWLLPLFVCYIR
jgi:hypothetical protein